MTMFANAATRFPARQKGATLVIALLILVLIMMIGITAISTSNTQFKLAGNLQFEDSAMNNSEAAITAAEQWLSAGTNYKNAGFTAYAQATTPQLVPIAQVVTPLMMTWIDLADPGGPHTADANSLMVGGNTAQRYLIQQMSRNNRLLGSSAVVGGSASSGCNQVNTYQITARGLSARGATRFVQSFYSVLSCP